ncbi:MAG: Crp/Fnr family transcriptional regulator, partial [Desulfobacterales bacterium]|nr:Crp/Fnr family transcriptional regulator [Desulfobacterales bacterium]
KVDAFKEMNEEQKAKLLPFCEELDFKRGDKLFTEGDDARHLWTVIEGQVDLRFEMPDRRPASADQTISSVEVGKRDKESKTLGWSCFVPPFKMRLSAFCVTGSCKVVRVRKQDLFKLFKKDARMGFLFMTFIVTVVGYRFHQFQGVVAKNMGEDLMFGW